MKDSNMAMLKSVIYTIGKVGVINWKEWKCALWPIKAFASQLEF